MILMGIGALHFSCSPSSRESDHPAVNDVFTELPSGSIRFNGYLENDMMKNLLQDSQHTSENEGNILETMIQTIEALEREKLKQQGLWEDWMDAR